MLVTQKLSFSQYVFKCCLSRLGLKLALSNSQSASHLHQNATCIFQALDTSYESNYVQVISLFVPDIESTIHLKVSHLNMTCYLLLFIGTREATLPDLQNKKSRYQKYYPRMQHFRLAFVTRMQQCFTDKHSFNNIV